MDNEGTQKIAWDGISFTVPNCWEPSKIGKKYLLLSQGAIPVMEVKWGPAGKSFTHEKYLSRLVSGQKGELKNTIKPETVSRRFAKALSGYDVSGFSWENMKFKGTGLIVSCPKCRTITLVQFFSGEKTSPLVFVPVLSSFTDHREDQQVLWSLFGIKALIPKDLKLKKYRFNAGAFELIFASRKKEFSLYRWAPAGILLTGIDLTGFVQRAFSSFFDDGEAVMINGCHMGFKWDSPAISWWKRVLKGVFWLRQIRVWHDESGNLLFGVSGRVRNRKDMIITDRICSSYESV